MVAVESFPFKALDTGFKMTEKWVDNHDIDVMPVLIQPSRKLNPIICKVHPWRFNIEPLSK